LDRTKLVTRATTFAACAALIVGGLVAAAHADSALQRALRSRKQTVHRLEQLHELRHVARLNLHHQIKVIQGKIHRAKRIETSLAGDQMRSSRHQAKLASWRHQLRSRLHKLQHFVRRRTVALRALRDQLTSWVNTWGVLRRCPVDGPHDVTNNFGVIVQKRPGVPRHIHQGNDIMASTGTPIVAPFDGNAVAVPNTLGGQAVNIYGADGFVYNAHLSAYGKLGQVKTGDVIGYVGSTGDAGGPHDHFEWHPGNGAAVDPYPYLMAVC
jgi:murein DD-endopeptidase MepM/ murein hydrolase activator NlpD